MPPISRLIIEKGQVRNLSYESKSVGKTYIPRPPGGDDRNSLDKQQKRHKPNAGNALWLISRDPALGMPALAQHLLIEGLSGN